MCRRAGVKVPSQDQISSRPRTLFSLCLVSNPPSLRELAALSSASPRPGSGSRLYDPFSFLRSRSPPGPSLSSSGRAPAASLRDSRGLPGSGACASRSLRSGTSLQRRLHTPGARAFARWHWAGAATGRGILLHMALPPRAGTRNLGPGGMAGFPRTPSPRRT